MKLNRMRIDVTTDGSGDGTGYGDRIVHGLLYAVQTVDGTFADGVDATLTFVSEVTTTAVTLTDFNTDSMHYPRVQVEDAAGAGVTYDGSNEIYGLQVIYGTPTLTIAQGGDTKTGGVILHFLE